MSDSNSIKLLKKTAEGIRTCQYCTNLGADQKARPMSTSKVEDNGNIWFFTDVDHGVADHADAEMVHLLYADNGDQEYLSVKGKAYLVDDRAKAEELWHPILNAWFPEGLETKDLRLLRVEPTFAEYWEGVSTARTVFDAVKAKVTGEKGAYGEHQKLDV